MFYEESVWIKDRLLELGPSTMGGALDIGSSSLDFRTHVQPYIDQNIFSLLRDHGVPVSHMDIKEDVGVDIVCDFSDVDQLRSIEQKFDLVFCTNVLEHLVDRAPFIKALTEFLNPGGYLMVTVPGNYRLHNDPIDTGFRPTDQELIALFDNFKPIKSEIVRIDHKEYYREHLSELLRYHLRPFRWSVSCLLAQSITQESPNRSTGSIGAT